MSRSDHREPPSIARVPEGAPRAPAETGGPGALVAKPTAPRARVLVVEDDAIVGSDIRQTLTRLGYAVLGPYAAAADSLTAVPEHTPDLVLMDIHTRGPMDGVEAAHILRERTGVPVIFLTAHSDPETVRRAGLAEPLGYVVKPFKATDLVSVIEAALDRVRVERAMRVRDREFAVLKAQLTTALDNVDGAVLVEDARGQITLLNAQLTSLLTESGCPDVALLQRRDEVFASLQTLLAESTQLSIVTERLLAGAQVERLTRRDSRVLELRLARSSLEGAHAGNVWTLRDVSEREQRLPLSSR